jgi:hypothetical protein
LKKPGKNKMKILKCPKKNPPLIQLILKPLIVQIKIIFLLSLLQQIQIIIIFIIILKSITKIPTPIPINITLLNTQTKNNIG